MKNIVKLFPLSILISGLLFTSCTEPANNIVINPAETPLILKQEVIDAQNRWGHAIVSIGDAYTNKEDYKTVAKNTVNDLYGYDEGTVLFTPTKASKKQFRSTKEEALSYFVGGVVPEDAGFAIQPWSNVRFENSGMILNDDSAIAMGNYYFTDANTGEETKVEFTFGYFKDDDGKLRINVHHSSLPYNPQN